MYSVSTVPNWQDQQRTKLSQNKQRNLPTKSESVRSISFKRHERLSFVHHSLWRIHSGYVRSLTWNAEGEFVPLGFWGAGDVVGYPLAQTSPYEAECVTAVTAEYLSVSHPLSREMVLGQIRQSNSLLRIVHCRNSEQRILQFLCWIAEHFGEETANGIQISLRLTHQEIAESIGTTRVTVTRLIKSLEKKKQIIWTPQEKLVFRQTFEQCYVRSTPHSKPKYKGYHD